MPKAEKLAAWLYLGTAAVGLMFAAPGVGSLLLGPLAAYTEQSDLWTIWNASGVPKDG